MKKTISILISLLFIISCINSYAIETSDLKQIETVIKKASAEFKIAKEEKDLKKLAEIAEKLYANHQLIKKLLNSSDPITFLCNNEKCIEPTLQIGDKLSVIFNLSFEDSEEYEKSKLIWQVQFDKKIVKKGDKEIYEKGGLKKFAKEITIDESFKNGKYRIAMHHKSETGTTKGDAFFTVKRPINVKEIVVSTNKAAKASDNAIYPDEDIYILSGFKLENIKNKINIDVKLVDSTKQETLIKTSFIRPKEDNKDKNQRLRFRIPASKLYKKQKLEFEMKLYAEGINPIVKKVSIPVRSFKLVVNTPNSLKSGKTAKYSIKVPKKFIKPYKVDISPSGGILVSHKTQLTGVITSVSKKNESASIYISVTDAKGKTVNLNKKIKLLTNTKKIIIDRENEHDWIVEVELSGEGNSYNKNFSKFIDESGLSASSSDEPDFHKLINISKSYDIHKISVKNIDYPDNKPTLNLRKEFFFQDGYLRRLIEYGYCQSKTQHKYIRYDYKISRNGSYEEKYYSYNKNYTPNGGYSCSQSVARIHLHDMHKNNKNGKSLGSLYYDANGSITDRSGIFK